MNRDEDFSTAHLRPGEVQFLELGAIIKDRYEVLKVLGNGGMGIVYQVCDRQMPGPGLCAIKETHLQISETPEPKQLAALKGLRLEYQYMSQLEHPAIPRAYNLFEWMKRSYLVMEYIEGETLSDLLATRQGQAPAFPEMKVIKWAIQICAIFAYLHQHRPPIYYRDCKPENFILTPNDTLRIIDFGIARQALEEPDPHYTELGTKGYAAPESFSGRCDARTDLFSLGVMMHVLLTFIKPEDIDAWDWLNHAPGLTRYALSPRLNEVILKCLQPEPDQRWQSANDLRDALYDLLATHPSGQLSANFQTPNPSQVLATAGRGPGMLAEAHRAGQRILGAPQGSEVMRGLNVPPPEVVWAHAAKAAIHAAPVLAGETIFFGSLDQQLYAVAARSGAVINTFNARAPLIGNPITTRHAVYTLAEDGTVYALDHALKRRLWVHKTREQIVSSPTILEHLLVFGTAANHVYGIPLDGGEPAWKVDTWGPVNADLATIGDRVYFGAVDAHLYAIDSHGQRLWRQRCRDTIEALPIALMTKRGPAIAVGSHDRTIYVFDQESGAVLWRRQLDGEILTAAACDGQYLYVGAADYRIYCLDLRHDLVVRWKYNTRSQITSDVVLRDHRLYFGCADGCVYCLDTRQVEEHWRHVAHGPVVARPLLLDDLVIVTSMDYHCYALRDTEARP